MSIGYTSTHVLGRQAKNRYTSAHAAPAMSPMPPMPPMPSAAARWAARRFGGLPREYWLLAAGAGLFRLGFFVIPFRAFYLSAERHLSVTAASMVMVAFGVGWAASQPLGGWLCDRIGRRAVITTGAFASAGAFLAFGSARGFALLALLACAAGLTFDLYRPALSALTTDVVPQPAQRKKALAVLYLTLNVGRGAACIIGGIVAGQAFWPLFAANAAINVLFGIAVYYGVRSDRPPRAGVPPLRLRVAFKDRRLLVFTGITLVFYTIHMQSVIALPLVLAEHGTKPLQFGLLLALDPLIVAGVQLSVQHKLLTTTALHACAAGVALVGVGLAVAGAGSGIGWYAVTMPLWIAGEVIFLAVAQDVVAALAPPQRVGSYFGLWGLSQGLAALLAPIVATVLIGWGGTGLLWACGAALGIAAAAACLAMQHHQQRRHTVSLRDMLAQRSDNSPPHQLRRTNAGGSATPPVPSRENLPAPGAVLAVPYRCAGLHGGHGAAGPDVAAEAQPLRQGRVTGSTRAAAAGARRTRRRALTRACWRPLRQPCEVARHGNPHQRKPLLWGLRRPHDLASSGSPGRGRQPPQRRDTPPARHHGPWRRQRDRRAAGAVVHRFVGLQHGSATRPGPTVTAHPRRWRLPAAGRSREEPPDRNRNHRGGNANCARMSGR